MLVEEFSTGVERRLLRIELNKTRDLVDRANKINRRYFDNKLKVEKIEYVTNQNSRFGCCNWGTGCIRISHKVACMPGWVRDYVVMHEMAHLVEPNHGKGFWQILARYRLTERARGYLMAVGHNITELCKS